MSPDSAPPQFAPGLPPEEAARADFYALLARLYYDAPDVALLSALAGADEIAAEESSGEGAGFALAWHDLTLAAAAADPAALEEEYQALFIGVGKAAGHAVRQRLSRYQRSRSATGRFARLPRAARNRAPDVGQRAGGSHRRTVRAYALSYCGAACAARSPAVGLRPVSAARGKPVVRRGSQVRASFLLSRCRVFHQAIPRS